MRIFLVGPGGAGKSTSGKILAELIGVKFIDLDSEFCDRIDNIRSYIENYGYQKYCLTNSDLFYDILEELGEDFVFVLSSGFLAYENSDLISKHKKTIEETGLSVMILPSESFEECRDIIVERQLSRGFGLKREKEIKTISERFDLYKNYGDIKIFSCENPDIIAMRIADNFK
jgi:shikimate kinase